VALNLAGVTHGALTRGHVVVVPERWHITSTVDASLSVLGSLDHDVSRRGAYVAYLGSGEHAVRLRVLGDDVIGPGEDGLVRLHLPVGLPLLPGDRYILRESGRDETIGGGEILDVAPVRRAAHARPDRSVERVVAERSWVDADELERLTGEHRAPTVGRWVAAPEAVAVMEAALLARVDAAGPLGLDVATLDERERAVVSRLDAVAIDGARARRVGADDGLADHPVLAALAAGGMSPPAPEATRAELRELKARGLLVERDDQWFHPSAIEAAAALAVRLLAEHPDGFTMAQFRDAAATTRKHALPLAAELDARGITRRRGDVRVPGPRLPTTGGSG
jgi:selenocysteine-specific elongation factor